MKTNRLTDKSIMKSLLKNHTSALTSYDLLKTLAVVLMIIDHLGVYFYPEDQWLRVFGRMCVPIWFFLIGYARARDIPKIMWIGGAVLAFSAFVAGQAVVPLPILFTLAAVRFLIDPVMGRALRTPQTLVGMFFVLFFLSLHSAAVFEYGTLGLLLAMYGFICRHRTQIALSKWALRIFTSAVFWAFIAHQIFLMEALTGGQVQVMVGGSALVFIILNYFSPREYAGFPKYAGVLKPVFYILGRWTLEVYVLHLLFFRGLSLALAPDRFGFLQGDIMSPAALGLFM